MFKTLFSRMLSTYLTVALVLLLLLGLMVSHMFEDLYITEKETEMRREIEQINIVVADKYMDDEKRPVALGELMTIARKYDALIQIRFVSSKYGAVSVRDEESAGKWAPCEQVDISEAAQFVIEGGGGSTAATGMFKNVTDMPIMTLTRPVTDKDNNVLGAIFLHADMNTSYAAVGQVYMDVLLCGCVAVILAILAVSYITGRITKPIVEMNKTVRSFSNGAFESRVPVVSYDEVGQLAGSFNIMADKLNALEQARRSFVANVSHELRSPLTSMRGFLEAMQDGTIQPEEFGKYLDVVIGENRRMTAMVNDLLNLARIESGQYSLKKEAFDINELIRRTLITFEARISAKSIDVNVELDPEPAYVEADADQIAQVVHNLVDNAIKFSPAGGKLRIGAAQQKKDVLIHVANTGAGIAEEDVPYIFDRFYKAEKAHTPSGSSGTGLGLSIVKRIIDQHEQSISVSSEKGGETIFRFTLKRAAEQPARVKKAK